MRNREFIRRISGSSMATGDSGKSKNPQQAAGYRTGGRYGGKIVSVRNTDWKSGGYDVSGDQDFERGGSDRGRGYEEQYKAAESF